MDGLTRQNSLPSVRVPGDHGTDVTDVCGVQVPTSSGSRTIDASKPRSPEM